MDFTMSLPLEKFNLFTTDKADEAREIVSQVYCDHTLVPEGKCDLDAQHNRVELSDISLNYLQYGADVKVEPGHLDDFYLFQLPLDGEAEICTNNHTFNTSPGKSSVINPSEYTKMRWNRSCKKLMVQIKREALEQRLSRILMRPIINPILFHHEIKETDNPHAGSWWNQIWNLVQELDNGLDPWRSRFILEDLERSLLTSMLFSFNHNYRDILRKQESTVAPKHVKKLEEYIHNHLQDNITIDDLVSISGVTSRSIYNGFKSFLGTTPMKYILQARLEKVREDLLNPNQSNNVTQIATKWNFTQLGRFAACYKKVFGESPTETLHK
ncbi:MAG: AraC family transcriptional regulator [Gammaproteobacteria bacterium]|nr:MAG: AraC family transcriptional regulator [Gammaproteobacteria bacterium]